MDIVSLSFEEPLILVINEQIVRVIMFQTAESHMVKFGIDAPRSVSVHREEIQKALLAKLAMES